MTVATSIKEVNRIREAARNGKNWTSANDSLCPVRQKLTGDEHLNCTLSTVADRVPLRFQRNQSIQR
jgi:hypothetical protein